jgi:hypothetical protein
MDRNNKVFDPITPGAPLNRGFENIIELEVLSLQELS